ncbi:MAG: hypothetical protein OEZ51_15190 [Nitrospinota bacterium]|nr:hypothetical protein [Nitrospinota bacterium]
MNKKIVAGLVILTTLLGACSGAKTVTHKKWDENLNTVYLRDITVKGDSMKEAGSRLRLALENKFDDSLFIVGEEPARTKYQLKYQITQFDEGNRLKRLATFGIDDGSRALLSVKVALIGKEGVLGAWQVQTWVRGGLIGGSADDVFSQAAEQILQHMKGY